LAIGARAAGFLTVSAVNGVIRQKELQYEGTEVRRKE